MGACLVDDDHGMDRGLERNQVDSDWYGAWVRWRWRGYRVPKSFPGERG
jgi:hypothetical protein